MAQQATGRTPRIVNPEFQAWRLNEHGQQKVDTIRVTFDTLLTELKEQIGQESRYYSLTKTHLEEACMQAIKAVASQPQNQEN